MNSFACSENVLDSIEFSIYFSLNVPFVASFFLTHFFRLINMKVYILEV